MSSRLVAQSRALDDDGVVNAVPEQRHIHLSVGAKVELDGVTLRISACRSSAVGGPPCGCSWTTPWNGQPNRRTTIAPNPRNGPDGIAVLRAAAPPRAMRTRPKTPAANVPSVSAGRTAVPSTAPSSSASLTSPIPSPAGSKRRAPAKSAAAPSDAPITASQCSERRPVARQGRLPPQEGRSGSGAGACRCRSPRERRGRHTQRHRSARGRRGLPVRLAAIARSVARTAVAALAMGERSLSSRPSARSSAVVMRTVSSTGPAASPLARVSRPPRTWVCRGALQRATSPDVRGTRAGWIRCARRPGARSRAPRDDRLRRHMRPSAAHARHSRPLGGLLVAVPLPLVVAFRVAVPSSPFCARGRLLRRVRLRGGRGARAGRPRGRRGPW